MEQDYNENSKPATKLKDDPIFRDLTPAELAEVEAFDNRFAAELAKMKAIKEEIKQYNLDSNNLLTGSVEGVAQPPVKKCKHCGIEGKMLRCTRCDSVTYCSATCQKEDWKEHKLQCQPKPIVYRIPPDEERCKGCKGWGLNMMRDDGSGFCDHCFAKQ